MPEAPYKRLTRARLRSAFAVAVTSRSSLWLGPDHLLIIDTSGYTETYKRFYFRDIQSLTISLNRKRVLWNWILGVIAVVTVGIWALLFSSSPPSGMTLPLISFGTICLFLLPLVFNNLLGPTCTCYVRTAVQTEELVPLKRLRRARTIFDRLRPFITQAQGALPPLGSPNQGQSSGSTAPMEATIEGPGLDSPEVPPNIN